MGNVKWLYTVWLAVLTTLAPVPRAYGSGIEELVAELKENVVIEQPYSLGAELTFYLSPNQTARLLCTDNPQGLSEIVVAWRLKEAKPKESWGTLYSYVIDLCGNVAGGGVNLRDSSGVKKRLSGRVWKCFCGTTWDITHDKMKVQLFATTNRAQMKLSERPRLDADTRVECFVRLWSETKYNFAFFDQVPEVDWGDVLTEYLPEVRKDQTNYEFFRLMTKCVAQLHDGHTNFSGFVLPPYFPCRPPILIQCIESKAIIVEVVERKDIHEAELKRGMQITHVDGRPIENTLEQDLFPYITASTPQARDLEAYPRLLEGLEGSVAVVTVRGLDGTSREVKLTRNHRGVKKMWKTRWAGRGEREAGWLVDEIYYMPLDSFGNEEAIRAFDRALDDICSANGLILDIRDNGGGSSSIGYSIISYLTDKPLKTSRWKTRQYTPAFKAWGQEEKWHEGEHGSVMPIGGKKPFLGPVVVLVGPKTFSAAEDFLIPLHASGRATLVGGRTAGSTGQPLRVKLSGGFSMRICTKRDSYPDGREFVGVGVIPDVEVLPTQADIAAGRYSDGADPVLDRGLAVLKAAIAKCRTRVDERKPSSESQSH